MKSPQIDGAGVPEGDRGGYSDLKAMRSHAGWYVGSAYVGSDGFEQPGTRDSGYHATQAEAEATLRRFEATGETDR